MCWFVYVGGVHSQKKKKKDSEILTGLPCLLTITHTLNSLTEQHKAVKSYTTKKYSLTDREQSLVRPTLLYLFCFSYPRLVLQENLKFWSGSFKKKKVQYAVLGYNS